MRRAEFRGIPSSHAVSTSTPKDQWKGVVGWIEDQAAKRGRTPTPPKIEMEDAWHQIQRIKVPYEHIV